MRLDAGCLETLYNRLYQVYGAQHWWPADSRFEIMLGAILTQNTSWKNVGQAIIRLKAAEALNTHTILNLSEQCLAELIIPSGYFNLKARRIKNYTSWFVRNGKFEQINQYSDEKLRESLLKINGIGPESADDILLYAFDRPIFVIDAYTRRLFKKLHLINGDEDYTSLQKALHRGLNKNLKLFQEYHALIVRHAKQTCLKHIDCLHCYIEEPLI